MTIIDQQETKIRFQKKITLLSFAASLLIVLLHTNNLEIYNLKGSLSDRIVTFIETGLSNNIAHCAVPMFFAVSAFLFYKNYNFDKITVKYKSRLKSTVLPYLVWNTIYFILFFSVSRLPVANQQPVALNAANIINGIIFYKYNMVFWFLFQLILFILMSPILFALLRNKVAGALSILVAFAVYIAFDVPVIKFDALVYYLVGGYAALHFKEFTMKKASKKTILAAGVLLVLSELIWVLNSVHSIGKWYGLFCLGFVIGAYFFIDLFPIPSTTWFMKIPFFIYATHTMVLEIYKRLFFKLLPQSALGAVINYLIAPALTLLTIYFGALVLKTAAPKVFSVLTGGRGSSAIQ